MALVSLEDLRGAANVGDQFSTERLPQILAGAEGWLLGKVRRQCTPLPPLVPADPQTDPPTFTDSAAPVVHRVRVNGSRFIRVPDARVITKVTIDGVEVTDYELHAHRFPVNGPTTHVEVFIRGRVAEVTGRFGFLELPADLHEAIVTLAARRVYEESIGLVDSVSSGGYGNERAYVKKLPSPVAMVINDFSVPDDLAGFA